MKLVYFARVREQLGLDEETLVRPPQVQTLAELIDWLGQQRGEPWSRVLSAADLICAVNQQVAGPATVLADDDEVAFFPPVTGG